jgi:HSP20 family protein
MTIIRREPARELHSIQQEVNRLFGTFFDSPTGASFRSGHARRWVPAMDVAEDGDQYVLRADLPGVDEGDLKIEVEHNVLTISGERRSEVRDRKDGYYRVERASGSFSRSLTLPDGVDADSVHASFENGVLEVTIPKPAEHKPRRVEISVGTKGGAIEGSASDADSSRDAGDEPSA